MTASGFASAAGSWASTSTTASRTASRSLGQRRSWTDSQIHTSRSTHPGEGYAYSACCRTALPMTLRPTISKKGNIEVYVPGHTHRLLTVTGNALNSTDITETAEVLRWLLDTYMRRPVPSAAPIGSFGKSYLSDESVIEKASLAKNGEKFQRLWRGDITG